MDAIELVEGRKYRVSWKSQGGNYRWSIKQAVWTFVGYNKAQYGPDQLIWSGRPACGTQDMDVNSYLDAVEVDKATKNTQPVRIGPYEENKGN
jgi:hypothetical protein